jgi:hypothetical protein
LGIDLMPFDTIGIGDYRIIKIGIRGVGRYHVINQELKVSTGSNSTKDHGGQLISYFDGMIGPVLRYTPFATRSSFDSSLSSRGGLTVFALAGQIFNGNLTAFPAMRNDREFTGTIHSTSVSGWRFDIGMGGEFTMCNANLGLNVFYSYTGFKMKDKIYSDIGKSSKMNEMCVEVYMGIPIELI